MQPCKAVLAEQNGNGDFFTAGRLGQRVVVNSADGGTEILLGDPIKFDRTNIDEWRRVY